MYFWLLYFFVYGFLGWCLEVAFAGVKERRFVNRGFLNGPICPIYGIGVSVVVQFLGGVQDSLVVLYLCSMVLVTALEWLTGFVLDKLFHHKWWDYSNRPLNLGGYVCLLFSMLWGAACVAIVKLVHPLVHRALAFLPPAAGWGILAVLVVALGVDLYVTVSDILKLNRYLARMDEVAKELRRISDEIGENIYGEVIEVMEWKEEAEERMKERTEKLRARGAGISAEAREEIRLLRVRYQELLESDSVHRRRLLKAFPKMQSRRYQDALEDIRRYLRRK